jgi:RNA polymerase sigma-70 factor (ECF subfamily)
VPRDVVGSAFEKPARELVFGLEGKLRLDSNEVEKIRGGDSDAFEWLYRRYVHDMYRVALRLTGTSMDAEDVVHDVFVRLPQSLGSLREIDRLRPWLRAVTVNCALMLIRTQRKRGDEPIAEHLLGSQNPEPRLVASLTVRSSLAGLPEHLRIAVILKEVMGFTHAEIADMLGITAANSMVRLTRARRQLRVLILGEHDRETGT